MENTEIAYIAGLFDGEGCVQFRYRTRFIKREREARQTDQTHVVVSVNNTNTSVLEYLRSKLGGAIHFLKTSGNRKPYYEWRARRSQSFDILRMMLPYLRIKRERVFLLLAHETLIRRRGNTRSEQDKETLRALDSQFKALNKTGLR